MKLRFSQEIMGSLILLVEVSLSQQSNGNHCPNNTHQEPQVLYSTLLTVSGFGIGIDCSGSHLVMYSVAGEKMGFEGRADSATILHFFFHLLSAKVITHEQ